MSTSTENQSLETDSRVPVAAAAAPPEVFASFRNALRAPSVIFQRPIGSGSYAVVAKVFVELPAGSQNTTVKGVLRLDSGDFDESRASLSTGNRFATLSWVVVGEIGLNPDTPMRLQLETNPATPVDFRFMKMVATRVNDVVSNTDLS